MATATIRRSSRARRSLTGTLLAFASLSACTTHVGPDDTTDVEPNTPEVPLRAVEVMEAGAGDTTVVFESGLGNDWTPWTAVASEVAAHARMFAYSRPGYGGSEPTPEPRDAARIVDDLRTLLATRGYSPPYLLVGHSFGGTYMELFAKANPDDVSGLVLVDPRHRDFDATCKQRGLQGCSIPASVAATLPPVEAAELEAFARASGEIRSAGVFGTYPVRVLTATSHGFRPEVEALWVSPK